jgi:hypothetical protein
MSFRFVVICTWSEKGLIVQVHVAAKLICKRDPFGDVYDAIDFRFSLRLSRISKKVRSHGSSCAYVLALVKTFKSGASDSG